MVNRIVYDLIQKLVDGVGLFTFNFIVKGIEQNKEVFVLGVDFCDPYAEMIVPLNLGHYCPLVHLKMGSSCSSTMSPISSLQTS